MFNSVALYNQCFSAQWGGGINYHLALAAAFSDWSCKQIEVEFPTSMNFEELRSKLPQGLNRGHWKHQSEGKRIPLLSEFLAAWADRRFDCVIRHGNSIPRYTFQANAFLQVDFPRQKQLDWKQKVRLNAYRGIFCNSNFTAKYIQHYWGKQAMVLYPPVEAIPSRNKKNIILSTGRFVRPGAGRSKRQDAMIDLFIEQEDQWEGWELHLAGYIQDLDYQKELLEKAKGHRIVFHFNALRPELESLIGEAKLYWHAVGLGLKEEDEPLAMEHFGISTVEAMSAGAVPVVIAEGGQKEIVQHGGNGFLWSNISEWKAQTNSLIADETKLEAMAKAAQLRAEYFSFQAFKNRLNHYLSHEKT